MGEHAGTILGHVVTKQQGLDDLCQRALEEDAGRKALTVTLVVIAEGQVRAGDTQSARRTFSAALDSARSVTDKAGRANALQVIAEGQARTGNMQAARQSFSAAL